MSNHKKLKKKKMFDYPECDYNEAKKMDFRSYNQFLNSGCTIKQCVKGHYYHGIDNFIEENGMDKFVAMLTGMLFMIEHDYVDKEQAINTSLDIKDFETGEYDELFTPEDLKFISADIKTIKEFFEKHPQIFNN